MCCPFSVLLIFCTQVIASACICWREQAFCLCPRHTSSLCMHSSCVAGVAFALDESLDSSGAWPAPSHHTCLPPLPFGPADGLAALVLKPSRLGGIEVAMGLAAQATEQGVQVGNWHLEGGSPVRVMDKVSLEEAPVRGFFIVLYLSGVVYCS